MKSAAGARNVEPLGGRRFLSAHQATPATHLLSNGRYAVMLTAAGSGYSRWRDLALTRWREDATCDDWGSYIYLKTSAAATWSAGFQPSGVEPDDYDVVFNEDRAEFTRRDGTLTTMLEVVVSAEDDAEVRRVSITNSGNRARDIEITSYAELVLAPQADDVAHPAFLKLFVETEYLADLGAILATRRRRSPTDPEIWAAHLAVVDGETVWGAGDGDRPGPFPRPRARRPGADRGDGRPAALQHRRHRARSGLRPAAPCADRTGRDGAHRVLDGRRGEPRTSSTSSTSIATPSPSNARVHAGLDPGAGAASSSRHRSATRRACFSASPATCCMPIRRHAAASETIRRGRRRAAGALGPGHFRRHSRSFCCAIDEIEDIAIIGQLLRAHEYWRMKQLAVDLVILNERSVVLRSGSADRARDHGADQPVPPAGRRGAGRAARVFVLRADLIAAETRALLPAVARVVLVGQRGSLSDQLDRVRDPGAAVAAAATAATLGAGRRAAIPARDAGSRVLQRARRLRADGREYVTILGPGQSTPAPWINVIANPAFGFQVAAEGGGYTWSVNSRENQLTPWSNDPVTDRPGEAFLSARRGQRRDLWGRPRCRSATKSRPMSPGMAGATAGSSMTRTASRSICCSTCRSAIRSRSRA